MPTAPSRPRLRNARRLIVNADDFGFNRDVNAGIVEAHERGILTATTLMANGAAFEDAVRLAREHPELDVGCHLVLVQGESLLTGEAFPATPARLAIAVALGRIRIFDELAAQVRKIQAAGIEPTTSPNELNQRPQNVWKSNEYTHRETLALAGRVRERVGCFH